MEEMEKSLRRQANIQGGVLLGYHVLMNVAVFAVMLVAAVLGIFAAVFAAGFHSFAADSPMENTNAAMEILPEIMEKAAGWGYLLAVAIGLLILLLWKKPSYIRHTLLKKGKPMTFGSFLTLLTLVLGCQLVAQLFVMLLLWLGELVGISFLELLESVSADTDTLAMLLYVGLAAPISEELLFRGLLLRAVEPYNKKLAILASALLFGLYHGNPIQTPYAFLVGLVLGYVALEYHLIWAVVLHLVNNLFFADTLPRLLSGLPVEVSNWIQWAVIILFFLGAVLVLAIKGRTIWEAWKQERVEPWQRKAFFRSPTILILIGVCLINMLLFLCMGFFGV